MMFFCFFLYVPLFRVTGETFLQRFEQNSTLQWSVQGQDIPVEARHPSFQGKTSQSPSQIPTPRIHICVSGCRFPGSPTTIVLTI